MGHSYAVLILSATGMTAGAQVHVGDVILSVTEGRIVTGSSQGPERVFGSTFLDLNPPFTSDPGFDSAPGTFPAQSRIGFRILDALRRWDGVDFGSIAPGPLRISFSILEICTPEQPATVEGFSLLVGSNGQWHRHLEYTLMPINEPGIYLLSLQLWSNAGIGDSLPFWIVFSYNASSADHEAAIQWTRNTLASSPVCNPDVNCDGSTDGFDVEVMERAAGGDLTDFCQHEPDFNRDGSVDGFDVETLERVIGGAPCP
jgi:hypothetical protein